MRDLEESLAKTDKIISRIIKNPDDYDKEKLLQVVDSMKDLVKLAESKLVRK